MSKTMIIKNFYSYFQVVGFDDIGRGWSCRYFNTKEEAVSGTVELLECYGRDHYKVIDKTF